MNYRKKPIIIQARQTGIDYDEDVEIMRWCRGESLPPGTEYLFRIRTLEGMLMVTSGDWIICGVHGEFYPCKPDIFEATYEPVP